MSDQFWVMLAAVLPVLIVQWFQYQANKKTAAKSEIDRKEIKANVQEVRQHLDTVAMSKQETAQIIAGAERQNVTRGIEIGKQQATAPAPLGK